MLPCRRRGQYRAGHSEEAVQTLLIARPEIQRPFFALPNEWAGLRVSGDLAPRIRFWRQTTPETLWSPSSSIDFKHRDQEEIQI